MIPLGRLNDDVGAEGQVCDLAAKTSGPLPPRHLSAPSTTSRVAVVVCSGHQGEVRVEPTATQAANLRSLQHCNGDAEAFLCSTFYERNEFYQQGFNVGS
jgi:hypothetical protein